MTDQRTCRVCGCTDDNACLDPAGYGSTCRWVAADLCSTCYLKDPATFDAQLTPSVVPMVADVWQLMDAEDIDQDEAVRRLGGTP